MPRMSLAMSAGIVESTSVSGIRNSSAIMLAMPRADHLSLTADGLKMPSVDHMSNRDSLNVVLDRTLSTIPADLPNSPMLVGLFTNFVRLTDKALREYDAARAELFSYLEHSEWLQTGHYLRAIDHMENSASAIHRAVLNSSALRQLPSKGERPTSARRSSRRCRRPSEDRTSKLCVLQC